MRWDFNVLVALAWTWTTNALVVIPLYYAFHVTGQLLLGNWHDVTGYHSFDDMLERAFALDLPGSAWVDWPDAIFAFIDVVLVEGGVAILIGSLPWAAATGTLGYFWTLRFVRSHRAARQIALAQRKETTNATMAAIPVQPERRH